MTAMITRRKGHGLLDVPEHRFTPRFEVRATDDEVELSGYASTFEPYEMYGGPARGGWIEQLHRNAFDKTLDAKPDLHLLINHEGMPLARTKSGTLTLSVDDGGLKVAATLDRSDPDVQRLEPKMRRGDMNEMSFAFRVKKQRWDYAPDFDDDPYGLRTIEEVSLHKGDVSVVNFGANPTTSAELLSVDQALSILAECDPAELVEARASTGDEIIQRAQAALDMLARKGRARSVIDLGDASSADAARSADIDSKPTVAGRSKLAAPDGPRVDAAPAAPADEDRAPAKKGMSLREALVRQGLATDDGSVLSLNDALAHSGQ